MKTAQVGKPISTAEYSPLPLRCLSLLLPVSLHQVRRTDHCLWGCLYLYMFNIDALHGNLLAVADEEGSLRLMNTQHAASQSLVKGTCKICVSARYFPWFPSVCYVVVLVLRSACPLQCCIWYIVATRRGAIGTTGMMGTLLLCSARITILCVQSPDDSIWWHISCSLGCGEWEVYCYVQVSYRQCEDSWCEIWWTK